MVHAWAADGAADLEGHIMAFYTFRQNSSRGWFDIRPDEGITVAVIVEADSDIAADAKAESIGIYFDGEPDYVRDCDCCGPRWSRAYGGGTAEPMIYGEPARTATWRARSWTRGEADVAIHYVDGSVELIGAQS